MNVVAFALGAGAACRAPRRRARLRCSATPPAPPPSSPSAAATAGGALDGEFERQAQARARWALAERAHSGGEGAFWHELGASAAGAIADAYDDESRVLVVCGPGRNGRVGLQVANALVKIGMDATVYYASATAPSVLAGVRHMPFVPSTAEYYWDVAVDAVLGIGYDGGEVRDSACDALHFVAATRLPVASIDVPSGWDVDFGSRAHDVRRDVFVRPDTLVSLGRVKPCARKFAGRRHYLYDWEKREGAATLVAANEDAAVTGTGEIYGRPGAFQATLFSAREQRRVWVYPDDEHSDIDCWDEIG